MSPNKRQESISISIPLLPSPTLSAPRPSITTKDQQNIKNNNNKYAAPILVTIASFTRTIYGIAVKILSSTTQAQYTHYGFPSFELVAFRSAFTAVGAFVGTRWQGKQLMGEWYKEKNAVWDLMVRVLAGFGGLSMNTWTAAILPLGDNTVLQFIAPVFTGILAIFILGEKYELSDMITAAIASVGVVLVAKPTFIFGGLGQKTKIESVAVVVSIVAALLTALVSVQTRKMGRTMQSLQIVFFYNASAFIMSLLGSLIVWKAWKFPSDAISWSQVMMIFICGFAQQYAYTKALSLDKAAKIASMGYIQVLFSFIADYVVFNNTPELLSVIGAIVVGIGITYQGYVQYHRTETPASVPPLSSRLMESDEESPR